MTVEGEAQAAIDEGILLASQGKHEEAIACFRAAEAAGAAWVGLNSGNSFQALGRLGEAEADFRRAWVEGEDQDAAVNLALLLRNRGDVEAADILDSLIAQGNAQAAFNRALDLVDDGQKRRAIGLLRSIRTNDPRTQLAVSAQLGVLLEEEGRFVEAEPFLRRAFMSDEDARASLGLLLARTGHTDEAVSIWREGVAAGQIASMVPLANYLCGHGSPTQGKALYERAAALGDAFAMTNLAIELLDEGRDDESRSWLDRAIEAGDPRASEILADIS